MVLGDDVLDFLHDLIKQKYVRHCRCLQRDSVKFYYNGILKFRFNLSIVLENN